MPNMEHNKQCKQNNRTIGTKYEKIAGNYLEEQGYKIISYNYRCPLGEIDIIAKDKEEIVFVEVKYRKNLTMGSPLEAVTVRKQNIINKCAQYYLVRNFKYEISCRFDVIGIINDEIIHVKYAFS